MKLLILGGTRFLGRHLAGQALEAGHAVTLLHRGRSDSTLFPEAQHLVVDRNGDLAPLGNGRWDVAIDTSAYVPRHVASAAAHLAGRVAQYQMVSTISVYRDFPGAGAREEHALQTLDGPATETVDGRTYGPLKALCEQTALAAFGAGATLLPRPGLLVGPFDPSERFTWWLRRMLRGGEVLAPGRSDAPVQCIDARDAAAWMLRQAETGTHGVFNLTGPAREGLTLQELLATMCRRLAPPGTALRWVDEPFLLAQGVQPWTDLPLWLPSTDDGLHRVDIARALATGLACRPLAQTIDDTAAWAATQPPLPCPPGLEHAREAALLAAWRAGRAGQ